MIDPDDRGPFTPAHHYGRRAGDPMLRGMARDIRELRQDVERLKESERERLERELELVRANARATRAVAWTAAGLVLSLGANIAQILGTFHAW